MPLGTSRVRGTTREMTAFLFIDSLDAIKSRSWANWRATSLRSGRTTRCQRWSVFGTSRAQARPPPNLVPAQRSASSCCAFAHIFSPSFTSRLRGLSLFFCSSTSCAVVRRWRQRCTRKSSKCASSRLRVPLPFTRRRTVNQPPLWAQNQATTLAERNAQSLCLRRLS